MLFYQPMCKGCRYRFQRIYLFIQGFTVFIKGIPHFLGQVIARILSFKALVSGSVSVISFPVCLLCRNAIGLCQFILQPATLFSDRIFAISDVSHHPMAYRDSLTSFPILLVSPSSLALLLHLSCCLSSVALCALVVMALSSFPHCLCYAHSSLQPEILLPVFSLGLVCWI